MSESTHAHEYWLRQSAERAIQMARSDAPASEAETAGLDPVVLLVCRADNARRCFNYLPSNRKADRLERIAAYLLRAAAILRREETRR
ncbi:MAG TPA: hypothetical protein PLL78_09350 [Fimbriimonadaceae bacterium]|nr:hypothetical protein [Fimbriimonadaceae bacterium]